MPLIIVPRTLRVVGRVLTGSTYTILGLDAMQTPGARPEMAAATLNAMRRVLPMPGDDEVVVRFNAAVQVAGGMMIAFGRFPRLSAATLVASLVPTTIAGHAFWTITDPSDRKAQRVQFHKNIAMIGGLLIVLVDSITSQAEQSRDAPSEKRNKISVI